MPSNMHWATKRTWSRQSLDTYIQVLPTCNRPICITHWNTVLRYLACSVRQPSSFQRNIELYLSCFTELLCTNCVLVFVQHLSKPQAYQHILNWTQTWRKRCSRMVVRTWYLELHNFKFQLFLLLTLWPWMKHLTFVDIQCLLKQPYLSH